MKTVLRLIVLLLCFFYFDNTFAQGQQIADISVVREGVAKKGTYQFVFQTSATLKQVDLTPAQLLEIEKSRDPNLEIFVRIEEGVLVKILSKSVINDPNFNSSLIPDNLFFNEMDMTIYSDIYKRALNLF